MCLGSKILANHFTRLIRASQNVSEMEGLRAPLLRKAPARWGWGFTRVHGSKRDIATSSLRGGRVKERTCAGRLEFEGLGVGQCL